MHLFRCAGEKERGREKWRKFGLGTPHSRVVVVVDVACL